MTDFTGYKIFAKVFLWFVLIYVVLFQFILPFNSLFPAPSIMFYAIGDLFTKYNFASALGFTTLAVIFIPIGGFACFYLTKAPFMKLFLKYDFRWLENAFRFFPYMFFIFILAIWTGDSFWGEVIALMLFAGLEQKSAMAKTIRVVPSHFSLFAKSAGLSDYQIYDKIYGKLMLPYTIEKIGNLFLIGWVYAFVYEMVSGNYGVGNIILQTIKYGDSSAFFLIILIMIIVIYLFGLFFKFIQYKVVKWIPDEF